MRYLRSREPATLWHASSCGDREFTPASAREGESHRNDGDAVSKWSRQVPERGTSVNEGGTVDMAGEVFAPTWGTQEGSKS